MILDMIDRIYAAILAGIEATPITGLTADHCYNDVNPNRVWDGCATVELARDKTVLVDTIGDERMFDSTISINVKGPDKPNAKRIAGAVDDIVDHYLATIADEATIDYVFDEMELFPDVEGNTVNDEFWVIYRYTITHE